MATGLFTTVRRKALVMMKGDATLTALVPAASIYSQRVPGVPTWPYVRMGPMTETGRLRPPGTNGGIYSCPLHAFARDKVVAGQVTQTAESHADAIGAALEDVFRDIRVALTGSDVVKFWLTDKNLMEDQGEAEAFHWFAQINARVIAA